MKTHEELYAEIAKLQAELNADQALTVDEKIERTEKRLDERLNKYSEFFTSTVDKRIAVMEGTVEALTTKTAQALAETKRLQLPVDVEAKLDAFEQRVKREVGAKDKERLVHLERRIENVVESLGTVALDKEDFEQQLRDILITEREETTELRARIDAIALDLSELEALFDAEKHDLWNHLHQLEYDMTLDPNGEGGLFQKFMNATADRIVELRNEKRAEPTDSFDEAAKHYEAGYAQAEETIKELQRTTEWLRAGLQRAGLDDHVPLSVREGTRVDTLTDPMLRSVLLDQDALNRLYPDRETGTGDTGTSTSEPDLPDLFRNRPVRTGADQDRLDRLADRYEGSVFPRTGVSQEEWDHWQRTQALLAEQQRERRRAEHAEYLERYRIENPYLTTGTGISRSEPETGEPHLPNGWGYKLLDSQRQTGTGTGETGNREYRQELAGTFPEPELCDICGTDQCDNPFRLPGDGA